MEIFRPNSKAHHISPSICTSHRKAASLRRSISSVSIPTPCKPRSTLSFLTSSLHIQTSKPPTQTNPSPPPAAFSHNRHALHHPPRSPHPPRPEYLCPHAHKQRYPRHRPHFVPHLTSLDLGRSVTITSEDPDQDDTVIYPDYRRAVTVTSANPDEDDTVIYPDYRRSVTVHSEGDEDDTVIYPDY